MVNIFSPKNNKIDCYNGDTLFYYLNKYGVEYDSDPKKDGYMLFEPYHFADLAKLPKSLTDWEYQRIKDGRVKLLLFFAREPIAFFMIRPSVQLLNREYNIPLESIVIVTGNFGEQTLEDYPTEIKVIPFFFFDMQMLEKYTGREHISKNPSKKYLCYNSVVKMHRTLLFLLAPRKDGFISYLKRKYVPDHEMMQEIDSYKVLPENLALKAKQEINKSPRVIDITTEAVIKDQYQDNMILYEKTAFSIVTESIYCDLSLFITEKTFKPILSMHPFIILGSPGIHKFLETFGYKNYDFLFENFWEIDNEPDMYKRCCLIVDAIEKFKVQDYIDNIERIREVAEFNKNVCLTNDYNQRLSELLSKL